VARSCVELGKLLYLVAEIVLVLDDLAAATAHDEEKQQKSALIFLNECLSTRA
jgi:hypothetical protein